MIARRTFLQTTAFAAIATAIGSRGASAADPLGIALILPSPLGDVGWSHTLAAGLEPIKAAYGDAVTFTILENIAEGPDADRIMNKAVADGSKVLIAGSFGYQNGAMQIAKRDPSVTVLHASGFMVAPNFSPFAAKYFQGTYLMGMAAAALSKSGKLGSGLCHSRTDHLDQRLHAGGPGGQSGYRSIGRLGQHLVRPCQGTGSRQGPDRAGL